MSKMFPPAVYADAPSSPPVRRRAVRVRRTGVDLVIVILVVLGVVAAWAATVTLNESAQTGVDEKGEFVTVETKTPVYYGAHAIALASITAAGVLAALSGRFRRVSPATRVAFYVLLASAVLWAAIAYPTEDLFSTEILGATGPFVWITLLLVLAAADRLVWKYLDPVIQGLAYISTGLAWRALASGEYNFYLGFSKYIGYAILMMWLGGWTLLSATRTRGWRLLLRSIPALTMILMALCSQSRSWVILSCLLGIAFILLRARERGSILQGARTLVIVCVLGAVLGALVYVVVPRKIDNAIQGLASRMDQDTRSGQYKDFFATVPLTDLILGRGPKGTWYWQVVGDYQYFDNGYLWMLFIGGLPVLLSYVVIVLVPAFRTLRRKPMGSDAAAVCLTLFWGLALTGLSTFTLPSVGISSYLVSLYAGRCHLILAESGRRKRSERPAALDFSRAPAA